MSEVFLSVVVPVHNALPTLGRCLDSILAQTFGDIEILLVDDASCDGGDVACGEYAARNSSVRALRADGRGVVAARQAGVAEAAGRYIGFVDADDWIEPDMFALLCAAARRNGDDVVLCDYAHHVNGETRIVTPGFAAGRYAGRRYEEAVVANIFCTPDRSAFSPICTQWNTIVASGPAKRETALLPRSLRLGEDTAFIMGCILSGGSLHYIDKPLYHYPTYPGSSSNRGWGENPAALLEQRALFYRGLSLRAAERPACNPSGQLESYILFLAMRDAVKYAATEGFSRHYLSAGWLRALLLRERGSALPPAWLESLAALELPA